MINLWFKASFERKLTFILFFALVLRLLWALLVPVDPVSDSVIYASSAENIAVHGVYGVEPDKPFSYWPVGTAAIYALGYKMFGVSPAVVIFLNLSASLALVYTSGLLARRWFDETVALVTAGILAFWPSLILYVTVFASEVFFALFVNLALLSWRLESRLWMPRAVAAGIMIALAAYVRPIALLFPLVLVAIEIVSTKRIVRAVMAATIVTIMAAFVVAPWAVRNTLLHGGFVVISTNGGPNLWMGNNPDSTGEYMPLPEFTRTVSEFERAQILSAEAKRYMVENPGRTLIMFLRKLVHTHGGETIAVHWNKPGITERLGASMLTPLKVITQAYWTIVLLLALAGMVLVGPAAVGTRSLFSALRTFSSPPLLCWLYFAVLHAVIVSQDRYHFPSIPFIAMLTSIAIGTYSKRQKGQLRP